MAGKTLSHVDFDLHGIVGVRLLNARPTDVRAVTRQLGPIQRELDREPDLVLRFEEQLSPPPRAELIGLNEIAHADGDFFLLRGRHKQSICVKLPLDTVFRGGEIVCRSGLHAVPHLISLMNVAALGNNFLPLHASAFEYEGRHVLMTGWSKGGKTETLVSFLRHGATYIGDEWIYLSADGSRMFGIPEPVRLWKWHLDQLPEIRARIPLRQRLRLTMLSATVRSASALAGFRPAGPLARLASRAMPILERQQYIQVPPQTGLGAHSSRLAGTPDLLLFVGSRDAADVTVEPMSARTVAGHMAASLDEERESLQAIYRRFLFASPTRTNELIETARERERDLLQTALGGLPSYRVLHPYPVSFDDLYVTVRPVVSAAPPSRDCRTGSSDADLSIHDGLVPVGHAAEES